MSNLFTHLIECKFFDLQKLYPLNDLTYTNCKATFVNLKSVDYENELQSAFLPEKAKELH